MENKDLVRTEEVIEPEILDENGNPIGGEHTPKDSARRKGDNGGIFGGILVLALGFIMTLLFLLLLFCYNKQVVIRPHTDFGEVAERFKAQSWKDCIRETVSRVRISPSPPVLLLKSPTSLLFAWSDTSALTRACRQYSFLANA